jgi:peptidoglycan hydrolase-like protein with peptidoglycan-binding domain
MNNRIAGFLVKSQQYYLKQLGFYNGPVNGIWGEECKEAMEVFKLDESFKPANAKRGNGPFIPFERLPKGFKWEVFDGQRGIIQSDNSTYLLQVQKLVDGILELSEAADTSNRRNALDVIGVKQVRSKEETDSQPISDYINNS